MKLARRAGSASARRALDERSTCAIWSFEWCNIANIHEAARRALDELARRALAEPARRASFIV